MSENQTSNTRPPQLTDRDAQLLSAYVDNLLSEAERQALEARLEQDAFLRRELAAMRQTVQWLNTLPPLKAPRAFTLTPAMVEAAQQDTGPANVVRIPRSLWYAAASAAALVLVVVGILVMLRSQLSETVSTAPAALQLDGAGDAPQIAQQATPTFENAPESAADEAVAVDAPTLVAAPVRQATAQTNEQAEEPRSSSDTEASPSPVPANTSTAVTESAARSALADETSNRAEENALDAGVTATPTFETAQSGALAEAEEPLDSAADEATAAPSLEQGAGIELESDADAAASSADSADSAEAEQDFAPPAPSTSLNQLPDSGGGPMISLEDLLIQLLQSSLDVFRFLLEEVQP